MTSTPRTRTAADVRAFYNDPEKGAARVASLPEGTNLACLGENARGRLAPAVIAGFNKGKAKGLRYESGNTSAVSKAVEAEAARLRALAVEQGIVKPKSRGPLPKSFLIAQGVVKG